MERRKAPPGWDMRSNPVTTSDHARHEVYCGGRAEKADARELRPVLCESEPREGNRACKERHEIRPLHSITSSALLSRV